MPFVSVIVPVYKAENFLPKCIDSILNQTYKDFELILVNDGSPDKSGKICDKYSEKDNRIIVIHKKNGGVSSARNIGIENATGKYICFVDSDDFLENNYLEELINTKENYSEVENIWCGFQTVTDYSKSNAKEVIADSSKFLSIYNNKDIMLLHEKWLDCSPWNKLYMQKIIIDYKIKFPEDMFLGEDLIFNLNYLENTNGKIIIINKPIYNYVRSGNVSLDNKYYKNLLQIYQRINSKVKDCLLKWNVYDAEIQKYYNMVYFSYERIFRNTMSKENIDSLFKKVKYNNSLIKSEEFYNCIKNMQYKLPAVFKIAYKLNNYYIIHMYEKLLNKIIKLLRKK